MIPDPVLRRRADTMAFRTRIALGSGRTLGDSSSFVAEYERLHMKVRGLGGHDFPAHAFVSLLWQLGERAKAQILWGEYCRGYRRERFPLPLEFALDLDGTD